MSLIKTPFGFSSTAAEVAAGIDLTGRRAVVTGGSSGIGVETARALAGTGAEVTLAVRDTAAGERVAKDITATTGNNAVHIAALDLSDPASVTAFVRGCTGPLHLLVANAGHRLPRPQRFVLKWRLHVPPTFGRRQVKSIRPSDIATWLADLNERFGSSTARTAFLVLHGALELAVADEVIKRNPAKSKIVQRRSRTQRDVVVWADESVDGVIGALPERYRCIPIIAAACGLRQGELFGLAVVDIDLDDDVIYVRRQVKRLGNQYVFARPKNDRERVVPLPQWARESIQAHLAKYGTVAVTLPWERTNGSPTTVRLLFRSDSGKHLQARIFDEVIWKPTLAAAGLIPAPTKDVRGRRRFVTDRRTGLHALRHFYASVTLADGVNVKELAEYLGHHDPGFTLRLYTHMLPSSFDRARRAIDNRMLRRSRSGADGAVTEQGRSGPSAIHRPGRYQRRPKSRQSASDLLFQLG
ncbi:MAG: hypothetical protein QOH50_1629 [Kribbellaceae bacterium]|jgi:integrase|nr:hypothetical protein [Kribbellaceae bacterium]